MSATDRPGGAGCCFVLSSPSGAGKTTITRRLFDDDPSLTLSVSVTTRPQRPGEIDGRDYRFIDQARFDEMVAAGEFLEHATRLRQLLRHAARGRSRRRSPPGTTSSAMSTGRGRSSSPRRCGAIWSRSSSCRRASRRSRSGCSTRAQDSAEVVAGRMAKSAEEMSHWPEYDYVIVNDAVEASVAQVRAIVAAERLRRTRQPGLAAFVERLRQG